MLSEFLLSLPYVSPDNQCHESPRLRSFYQTVKQQKGRLCCHSARPGQAGELGAEEPDEAQQGQVQGPAPGEEQPHIPAETQGWPAGEQLYGEGPGCDGG